jgi:release factor glutamine methyltransferase
MESLRKKYADYIIRPFLERYLEKPRMFSYEDLKLRIYPGVFHPKYFFSTLMMADHLKSVQLEKRSFCEVGAGSGLLSFMALKRKARVLSFDLNESAVTGLEENFKRNFSEGDFKAIRSDLFDSVPSQKFDILFINPPYFFKEVLSKKDLAWNCGKNGEYFVKLFNQLPQHLHGESEVYIVLAENCEIERIRQMAAHSQFNMIPLKERKVKWEKNFIFKLIYHGGSKPG